METAAGARAAASPPAASAARSSIDGRSLFPPESTRCRLASYSPRGCTTGSSCSIASVTRAARFSSSSSIIILITHFPDTDLVSDL